MVRDDYSYAATLHYLGMVAYQRGDLGAATALLERSLVLRRATSDVATLATLLCQLGLVAYHQGTLQRSHELYLECLNLLRDCHEPAVLELCLEGLALVIDSQHQPVLAALLCGAAAVLHEQTSPYLPQADAYLHALDTTRDLLDSTTFAASWSAGRSLSLDTLIAAVQYPVVVA